MGGWGVKSRVVEHGHSRLDPGGSAGYARSARGHDRGLAEVFPCKRSSHPQASKIDFSAFPLAPT
jgi:hypothetical protein